MLYNQYRIFIFTSFMALFTYPLFTSNTSLAQSTPSIVQTGSSTLLAANYLSPLEQQVIEEMNKVRTNPRSYVPIIENYRKRFQGNRVRVASNTYLITQEGVKAVDEAMSDDKPLSRLRISQVSPSCGKIENIQRNVVRCKGSCQRPRPQGCNWS